MGDDILFIGTAKKEKDFVNRLKITFNTKDLKNLSCFIRKINCTRGKITLNQRDLILIISKFDVSESIYCMHI